MDNTKKYSALFLLGVITFFVWRYISNPLVITVTGSGKVSVPATSARLSATVVDAQDTVENAESSLKAKLSAVRLAMVTGGINEKTISQSQIQITPLAAVVSGAKGFSATVTLYGQSENISDLNSLIVKLYLSGASIVSQPVVEVANQQELENSALKMALAEAQTNASYVAKLRWKMFKKIVSIQQASSGNTSTSTKVSEEKDGVSGSSFEVAKAVSAVYYLW